MDSETPLLLVSDLVIFYDSSPITRPISFKLLKNEIGILEGGNGSGKTSILKALTGQLDSYLGEVSFFGRHASKPRTWELIRAGLRIIPQFPIQPKFLKVSRYVNVWKRRSGKETKVVDSNVDLLRSFLDTGNIDYNSPLGKLSFGQSRLLDIALALIAEPQILIADEPFTGLAPKALGFVIREIEGYLQKGGSAIITVHSREQSLLPRSWTVEIEQIT